MNDSKAPLDEELAEPISARFMRLFRSLLARRRLFIRIVVAGFGVSILYAALQRNVYTSITTLMPPEASSSSSNLISLLSSVNPAMAAGGSAFGLKTQGALFVGILQSREVQEALVKRFDLVKLFKVKYVSDACKHLAEISDVKENVKDGIISIAVTSPSPELSAKLAQAYVDQLNSVVTNNSTSAARRERIFLEDRLTQIKQDLDNSAHALSQFSAKTRTIDVETQGKAMVESGLKLEDQLDAARAELASLREVYSEDNVRVRAAEVRIAQLQHDKDKMIGSPTDEFSASDGSSYPTITELPALGVSFADFDRKMKVEEALWAAMTKQYEAARVQEVKEIPTVRVLDAANIPQRKSGPFRTLIVIGGTFMAAILGIVVIFLASFWDTLEPDDERRLAVLEFAAIFHKLPLLRRRRGSVTVAH